MKYIKVTDVENVVSFQFDNAIGDGCLILNPEGFEDSVAINSIEDIASRIGAKEVNSKSGRRIVSWNAMLTCDALANRRLMLAALRRTGFLKLVEFETPDSLALRFYAYFDKLKGPYSSAINKLMMLQFSAPDPRFYSQTLHTQEIARNTNEVVENIGTDETCPVFRINGPFTSATITNLNNDQAITITETLIAGEYIEIDCANQTVKEDDGTSRYSSITGTPEFITLEPGENTIQFEDVGGDANTTLEVDFRDAYNSI